MATTDFTLQTNTKPAFENIIWSRPERLSSAGKLLIIGGHQTSFSATQQAFADAASAGAGQVRVCLPQSLEKLIGEHEDIYYLPQTPSGSFGESALNELKSYVDWADGVLLPGELSENSETELMMTKLLSKTTKPIVATGDMLTMIWRNLQELPTEQLTIVCDYKQLQQLIVAQSLPIMIKRDDSYPTIRDNLRELSSETGLAFVVANDKHIFVSADGNISQSDIAFNNQLPTIGAVVTMQFPKRTFEALTTAVYLSVTDN